MARGAAWLRPVPSLRHNIDMIRRNGVLFWKADLSSHVFRECYTVLHASVQVALLCFRALSKDMTLAAMDGHPD